jgi:hypothetical protein
MFGLAGVIRTFMARPARRTAPLVFGILSLLLATTEGETRRPGPPAGNGDASQAAAADSRGQGNDLDTFMREVMERRDDNWKKLQQYILDEREEIDIQGLGRSIWGERADYTWFIRDGFFVRSPLRVNGATVSESDRRKYEADYLRRAQNREKREREREETGTAATPTSNELDATGIGGFIQQTRQPEFVSSAYFLRFKFDSGRYALVGRETLDGHAVLRVEYYPTRLFSDDPERRERRDERRGREQSERDKAVEATINRLLNKGSRVTLWIEPGARQILKYTFDNVDVDFFPAQWFTSVTGLHATMVMSQPFPNIWLPRETDVRIGLTFAVGDVDLQYRLNYHDYRQADVTTAIRVPGAR